ncbi:unnamed protein product, partial [Polarella glacialis]
MNRASQALFDVLGTGCSVEHSASLDPRTFLKSPGLELLRTSAAPDAEASASGARNTVSCYRLSHLPPGSEEILVEHCGESVAGGCLVDREQLGGDDTGVALWPDAFALCAWLAANHQEIEGS